MKPLKSEVECEGGLALETRGREGEEVEEGEKREVERQDGHI